MDTSRLHVINLGLAIGLTWAAWLVLIGLGGWLMGWGIPAITTLTTIYPGYAPTLPGALIGAAWGLVCGFICGAVIACIYNFLQGRRAAG